MKLLFTRPNLGGFIIWIFGHIFSFIKKSICILLKMETTEGKTLEDMFRENKLLNLDLDMIMSRGTLIFLQFSNLMTRVGDIEAKLNRIASVLENNTQLLRAIKRSIDV